MCIIGLLAAQMTALSIDQDPDLFEMSLDELLNVSIYAASKLEEPILETPAVVSVITDTEIELFGGRDLGEILSRVANFQTWDGGTSGRYRMTIRADQASFNNNHVLILLDGVPLNRESYTGGIWTQSMLQSIPLSILERVEVVRGPGSVLYGTNAYSGVINLVTQQAENMPNQISVGAGNYDSKTMDFSISGTHGNWSIVSAVRLSDTGGWAFETHALDGDVVQAESFATSPGAMLVLRNGNFKATAFWGETEQFNIRGNSLGPVGASNKNEKYFLDLSDRWVLGSDWEIVLSASLVGGRTMQEIVVGDGLAAIRYKTDDSRLELNGRKELSHRLRVLLGTTLDYFNGSTPPPIQPIPSWSQAIFGVYGQIEYDINDTEFVLGAQYSSTSNGCRDVVPRAGLIHKFDNGFGLKLFFGQAFRSPYALETDANISVYTLSLLGNKDLSPEKVTTFDAQFFYGSEDAQASITLFRNEQVNLIYRAPTGPSEFTFSNVGELTIEGVEVEGKKVFGEDWYLTGSYTYQRNKDGYGVSDATLQPSSILKGGIGYTSERWSMGVFDSFVGRYKDNIILTPSRLKLNPPSESYHRVSANLIVDLTSDGDWAVEVYADNLLDEDVYLPELPGTGFSGQNTYLSYSGRSVLVKLRKRF